jgi:la-related protein 4
VNDSYLVSIMDSDYYVPLNTIYNFKRVKSLTTDTNLILEVLKTSTFLLLDKEFTKIKSSLNFQRRTCLIQGIPLNADFKV